MQDTEAVAVAATSLRAWAKVNLTLHVTGQRSDGYHLIDSLAVRVGVGDTLRITPSEQLELVVDGPFAKGAPLDDRNLVLRAARLLDGAGTQGARLHLTKELPAEAGIGGGSADAASALRLLSQHWGVSIPKDVAVLGADVPVCMADGPQRMSGIGEVLAQVGPLPECWLVLVNPGKSAPTPDVFRRLETKSNPPMPLDIPKFKDARGFAAWLGLQRNDLEQPAAQIVPEIAVCLAALQGALLARMSGSGATCFGLYETEDQAKHAAALIDLAHPAWWVATGQMLS